MPKIVSFGRHVDKAHTYKVCDSNSHMIPLERQDMTKDKTNIYWNYGSQEAGLVKHKLHPMNSKSIWYNKTRYKIHITRYTVHNIKGRIKHFYLLFWKWARA